MALTHVRAAEVATELKGCADEAKALLERVSTALTTNSNLAIDWAGDPKPAYLNESVDGNLDGFKFTRGQLANVIGSLDNFRKLMTNIAPSQGDHIGNVNQIADASV